MKISTVIFDLDGTLLDTLDDLKNAVNYALSLRGLPQYTRPQISAMVGNGIGLLIKRAAGENCDEALLRTMLDDFISYYKAHLHDCSRPYDGMIDLLRELKRRGYKTALVSNKWNEAVEILCKVFFNGLLDAQTGELDDLPRKPDRALVDLVLSRLGVQKDECLYVGDSGVDVETARNAELPFVGVTWGFRTRKQLLSCGAKNLIDRPEELYRYLEG